MIETMQGAEPAVEITGDRATWTDSARHRTSVGGTGIGASTDVIYRPRRNLTLRLGPTYNAA